MDLTSINKLVRIKLEKRVAGKLVKNKLIGVSTCKEYLSEERLNIMIENLYKKGLQKIQYTPSRGGNQITIKLYSK